MRIARSAVLAAFALLLGMVGPGHAAIGLCLRGAPAAPASHRVSCCARHASLLPVSAKPLFGPLTDGDCRCCIRVPAGTDEGNPPASRAPDAPSLLATGPALQVSLPAFVSALRIPETLHGAGPPPDAPLVLRV